MPRFPAGCMGVGLGEWGARWVLAAQGWCPPKVPPRMKWSPAALAGRPLQPGGGTGRGGAGGNRGGERHAVRPPVPPRRPAFIPLHLAHSCRVCYTGSGSLIIGTVPWKKTSLVAGLFVIVPGC